MHTKTSIDLIDARETLPHRLNRVKGQKQLNQFAGSALDWEIKTSRSYDEDLNEVGQIMMEKDDDGQFVETWRPAIHLSSGGSLIAHCFDNRIPIQNKEIFSIIQLLKDEFGFDVYSCGSIHARRKVFWTLEHEDSIIEMSNRKDIVSRLTISYGHDSSGSSLINTITCGEMDITLHEAINIMPKVKDQVVHLYNSIQKTDPKARLKELKSLITIWAASRIEVEEKLNRLEGSPVSSDDMKFFVAGLIGGDQLSPKGYSTVGQVLRMVSKGSSKWDLLAGIAKKYTLEASTTPDKSMVSSEFGNGAKIKSDAFSRLSDDLRFEKICLKGEKILKDFESRSLKAVG